MSKFYKTTITIEVLSEEPIPDSMPIQQIAKEAQEGGYSMRTVSSKQTVLTGKQTANALLKQGSAPSFFNLTPTGEFDPFLCD